MTKYDKERTLQAILDASNVEIDLTDFDLTQPDAMDEADSGGLWDLAGEVAMEFGKGLFDDKRDNLQTLLYNLMATYRCCDEEDEI